MKVLIIGGVAAGTKTAAKLKREDRSTEVTLITKGEDISYAGCGLPYYVGGLIEEREELVVNTPQKFAALTGVEVLTKREAVSVNSQDKTVQARNLESGEMETYSYDRLVIATGASPADLPIEGMDKKGIFKMRTPDDAVGIRAYIESNNVKKAVVIGAGFIGLEAAENLQAKGVSVTVIDFASQVLPEILDFEMAAYVKKHLVNKGIRVITGTKAEAILGEDSVTGVRTSVGTLSCELVISAAGIRPNTDFLKDSGIDMFKGTIKVDSRLHTNLPDVYAAGDCVMVTNRITGADKWSPMGSSANMEGRTLAQILNGKDKKYPGVLGTGVVKLPALNCGRTGLTEAQAKAAGYDVITALSVTDDKAHYYPDAAFFITKLIADKNTHKLLGAQILGPGAVDKMTDIAVMGISMNAKLEDFENVDFAYAPPFSTAIHPFVQAVYVLLNKIEGTLVSMTPAEFLQGKAEGYRIIDAGLKPSIHGADYVNLTDVNGEIPGIGKDEKILLVCAKGKRAYFLQNRLRHFGYTNTVVLEGATFFNDVRVKNPSAKVSQAEITKVKAWGFLWDKTTGDRFNCRIITRNGKITAEENRIISEAAELYGSGEITMTSRMTLEIQGVPYENIEPIR
ncbi:MAG: FAD-dependent oxidoreductase, partial [Clostridia bacterium]|nr:FAD-dependent oxidoreductase [Clostridia bacterium]MDY5555824.1 FAD-dependent oxidoreductase [Blautia sp.]